jgi:DNA-binding IclR family transcriptional regulator
MTLLPVPAVTAENAKTQPEWEANGHSVTSVDKALRLLEAFRRTERVAGVSELARVTGLPKSTAFRLLSELARAGFLERVGTDYQLNTLVFELGNCVPMCTQDDLRGIAGPFLSDLFLHSRYVVHLAVLDGTDVLYLDKIHGSGGIQVPTAVGRRMHASCSALGKAMLPFGHREAIERILDDGLTRRTRYSIAAPGLFLAELQRVRTHGVAFDREEAALGLTCVAAPILHNSTAIAAVSVSGRTGRFDPASLAARVQSAANEISALYARHLHELDDTTTA